MFSVLYKCKLTTITIVEISSDQQVVGSNLFTRVGDSCLQSIHRSAQPIVSEMVHASQLQPWWLCISLSWPYQWFTAHPDQRGSQRIMYGMIS